MAKPACWLSLSMFAAACMSVVAGLGVITATGKIEVCSGQKKSLVGETHVVRPGNVAFDCHRLSFRHASCMMQQCLRGMGTCRPPYTKSFATFTAKVLIVQSLWLRCSNISRSDPLITHRQAPDLVSAMGEGKVTNINSKDEWTSVHQKAGDKAVCARSHLH